MVMPPAPACRQTAAARLTSGSLPPRELRSTAILFTFTLSIVIRQLLPESSRLAPSHTFGEALTAGKIDIQADDPPFRVAPQCNFARVVFAGEALIRESEQRHRGARGDLHRCTVTTT